MKQIITLQSDVLVHKKNPNTINRTQTIAVFAVIPGELSNEPLMAAASTSNTRLGSERYFLGTLPMSALARQPHNVAAAFWIRSGIGLVVAVLGCWDFCRREVN